MIEARGYTMSIIIRNLCMQIHYTMAYAGRIFETWPFRRNCHRIRHFVKKVCTPPDCSLLLSYVFVERIVAQRLNVLVMFFGCCFDLGLITGI